MQLIVIEWTGLIHLKCRLILLERLINFYKRENDDPDCWIFHISEVFFLQKSTICAKDNCDPVGTEEMQFEVCTRTCVLPMNTNTIQFKLYFKRVTPNSIDKTRQYKTTLLHLHIH